MTEEGFSESGGLSATEQFFKHVNNHNALSDLLVSDLLARIAELEAENATLMKDKLRLDCLEDRGTRTINETRNYSGDEAWYVYQKKDGQTLRAAIDEENWLP